MLGSVMNNHIFATKQGTLKWGTNFDVLQPRIKVFILL